ncbi:MAG: tRNA lysidine(34) synthetase TilS [Chitinophagaceae bacterium]|nr:tRNA lysidine(34) synthetase TilS [Chitinophagaceae bacterium]
MHLLHLNADLTYLLAVSGGKDSMVMAELFRQSGIRFAVVHCNFQLRGEDSDADEVLVQTWCEKHQIRFYVQRFQTEDFAQSQGLSIQEAARILRYMFFKECLPLGPYHFLATAHHQDDAIETLLFHFFRGTGIRGLGSIPEKTDWLIRPLINYSREQISAFAEAHQVTWREDRSNASVKYTRNIIRHEVIPQLEQTFPELRSTLAKNIQRFKGSLKIYEEAILTLRKKLIEVRGRDHYIPIRKLLKQESIEVTLYELLKPFHFNWDLSLQVLQLLDSQSGAKVGNEKYRVIRHGDFLIITEAKVDEADFVMIESDNVNIETAEYLFKISKKLPVSEKLPADPHEIMVTSDPIEFPLILRKWKAGDYLYPFGMPKKKKVARILIDLKMPIHQKEKVRVLESGGRILWVAGIKQDDRTRVKPQTTAVYTIRYIDKTEKDS